jgi:uncharacterized protein (TIGR03118 family)
MTRSTLLCLFSIAVVSAQTSTNVYLQHNLISSVPGLADVTDPNLIAPWGMSFSATSPFWISNAGKGNTTLYVNASSSTIPTINATVVTIPAGGGKTTQSIPTGQVQNNTTGFLLANGKVASFIFATLDGTISAWNGGTVSTVMVDFSTVGTAYNGLAISSLSGAPLLYAANFTFGKIDVFDTNFKLTSVPGGFVDPTLPAGYVPFNIWPVNGSTFYVTYALANATKTGAVAGAGNGVVDAFDANGNFLRRVTSGGPLNEPWGVAMAPGSWGAFGGALLVGNFGDGHINAFNPTTGALLGTLQDATGAPIALPGLWAIAFGNNGSAGDQNYLYFTEAITNNGAEAGILGSLAPQAQVTQVQNAANALRGSIAPGEAVTLSGITVGPRPAVSSPSLSSAVNATTTLGGTSVTVNGIPAPVLYAQSDFTNIIVPFGVTGTTASIVVTTTGVASATTTTQTFTIPLAAAAPGIFSSVAFNQDGTPNSAANPAAAGSVVVQYVTGLGVTDAPTVDGARSGSLVLAEAVAPVTATLGGQAATVVYAGSAPGQIAGVMQVEIVVPAGAGTGPVPLVLTVGGVSSSTGASSNIYLK